jgi:diguanylate cyclase (GGDEF)-like protein
MTESKDNTEYRGLILLVDDMAQNLQVLCTMLGKEKYKIAIARSGQQALDMIEKVLPDLILLDVLMPGMDGFEVCRRLKKSTRTCDIPVIFLTAKTEMEDIVKGFEIGAVDYFTKPFNETELLTIVNTHMELRYARLELLKMQDELESAKINLKQAARTDHLTNLSNRRGIIEELHNERIRFEQNKRPFSLLLADVDHLKAFNDNHGHSCGDFLLVELAKLMKSLLRKQDTLARWEGEEFLFLLPETEREDGGVTAEKIKETVSNHEFKYNDTSLNVTLTIGVCTYGSNCFGGIDSCLKVVEQALNQGKKKGKNCVVTALIE